MSELLLACSLSLHLSLLQLVSPDVVSRVEQIPLHSWRTLVLDTAVGVDLGVRVIHPLTGTSLPVYAIDYVLPYYDQEAMIGE